MNPEMNFVFNAFAKLIMILREALAPLAILLLAMTLAQTSQAQISLAFGELSWNRINTYLDNNYPQVKSISTSELAALPTQPVLLDVREEPEYLLSHIPGAKRWSESASLVLPDKTQTIVVYCSVGLRSAEVAKKLTDAGYSNVRNLRGSMFMWANENRPLQGQSNSKVHPYNKRWGQLLDVSKRALLP